MNKNIIGILGGTFDPIHWGHIRIAEQLLKKLPFKEIRFLPNKTPPHRNAPQASLEDRLTMIKIAIENNPQFQLDLTEAERPGPSYMIDTIKQLRSQFPENPLALILGADVFAKFTTWQNYEEILDFTHIIIVNRISEKNESPKFLKEKFTEAPSTLSENLSGLIYECQLEPIPYSSTNIREKIGRGESIKEDLPPEIFAYISAKQLYGTNIY